VNTLLESFTFPQGIRFDLVQGDLTQEPVDAIVNAANQHLMHGGGIAAVISRVGGPAIDQESRAWVLEHGPVSHENPAYTSAGNLPQKYVIHAVGPVWGSGEEDSKLAAAVQGSLALAEELGLGSIAFPAISTGIFGFPKERAAHVIYQAVHDHFAGKTDITLQTVHMTVYDSATAAIFQQVWKSFHERL
jgi:O-acetyl-ADP-ribose deacetylase (regulator of RNase III)